jgi:hypothetical protein
MADITGIETKFTVLKNGDIEKYLHPNLQTELKRLIAYVEGNKAVVENKEPHTYLVINTDEPYADEVIEIMKRHGHWG